MEERLPGNSPVKESFRPENDHASDSEEDTTNAKSEGTDEYPDVLKLGGIFPGILDFTSGIRTSFLDFTSLSDDLRASIVDSIVDHEKQGKNYKTLLQLLEDSKVSTLAPIAYKPVASKEYASKSSARDEKSGKRNGSDFFNSKSASSDVFVQGFINNKADILKTSKILSDDGHKKLSRDGNLKQDRRFIEIVESDDLDKNSRGIYEGINKCQPALSVSTESVSNTDVYGPVFEADFHNPSTVSTAKSVDPITTVNAVEYNDHITVPADESQGPITVFTADCFDPITISAGKSHSSVTDSAATFKDLGTVSTASANGPFTVSTAVANGPITITVAKSQGSVPDFTTEFENRVTVSEAEFNVPITVSATHITNVTTVPTAVSHSSANFSRGEVELQNSRVNFSRDVVGLQNSQVIKEGKIEKSRIYKKNDSKRKLKFKEKSVETRSLLKKTRLINTRSKTVNGKEVSKNIINGEQSACSEDISEVVDCIEESSRGPVCCLSQCNNSVNKTSITVGTLLGNYQLKNSDENRVCEMHLQLDKDLHKTSGSMHYRKKLLRKPCVICNKMCKILLGYPMGYCQKGVTSVAGIPAIISCDSGCGYYEGEEKFVRVRSPSNYVCVWCFDFVSSRLNITRPVICAQVPSLEDPICALYVALTSSSSCGDDMIPSLEYVHKRHQLVVGCSTYVQGHCNEKCIVLMITPNFQVSARYLGAALKFRCALPWYRSASELSQEITQILAKIKKMRACSGLYEEQFLSLVSSSVEIPSSVKICDDAWVQISDTEIVKRTVRSRGEQYPCQGTIPKHSKLRCTNCTLLKNRVLAPLLDKKHDKYKARNNVKYLSEDEVRQKYYMLLKENREMRNIVRRANKAEGSIGDLDLRFPDESFPDEVFLVD